MKVYLATDHAGFEFKNQIRDFLKEKGYEVEDCGALTFDKDDDYPDFIKIAARKVASDDNSKGIVLGKSGAGECMAANKVNGVRAFLGVSKQNVQLAREHNDANVLSLGSEIVPLETAKELVLLFLETPFSNEERHVRRIDKMRTIEEEEAV